MDRCIQMYVTGQHVIYRDGTTPQEIIFEHEMTGTVSFPAISTDGEGEIHCHEYNGREMTSAPGQHGKDLILIVDIPVLHVPFRTIILHAIKSYLCRHLRTSKGNLR
jgi:hypothetical protein